MIKMRHLEFLEPGGSVVFKQTSAWRSSSCTCSCISCKARSLSFGLVSHGQFSGTSAWEHLGTVRGGVEVGWGGDRGMGRK